MKKPAPKPKAAPAVKAKPAPPVPESKPAPAEPESKPAPAEPESKPAPAEPETKPPPVSESKAKTPSKTSKVDSDSLDHLEGDWSHPIFKDGDIHTDQYGNANRKGDSYDVRKESSQRDLKREIGHKTYDERKADSHK